LFFQVQQIETTELSFKLLCSYAIFLKTNQFII